MHTEHRCFGPPGTGKTTWLAEQIEKAAGKFGGSNVIASSFTRAAATELISRDLPVPAQNVGTLHALCFRVLGRPKLATGKIVEEFVEAFPQWRLSKSSSSLDEPWRERGKEQASGEREMERSEILRSRMVPVERWPALTASFHRDWTTWKASAGLMDFTELIETALRECPVAPGGPAVGFVDEVQDLTPLQLALVRSWAMEMVHVVLCGDDDQCIYRWVGATPDAFLDPPLAVMGGV